MQNTINTTMSRKQNMKKRKKKKRKRTPRNQKLQQKMILPKTNVVRLLQYEITYDPVEDHTTDNLPSHVQNEIDKLYYMLYKNPKQAIPRLKELINKYPHIPKLYNFLSGAYALVSDTTKADALTQELYEKYPDYLFAKIQYAELCLRNKDLQKIPAIFNNKFDLQLLYPERKVFHVSEMLAFMGFMGEYSCQKSDFKQAEIYLDILKKLDPEDLRTQRLEEKLAIFSIFKKPVRKSIGSTKSSQQEDIFSKKAKSVIPTYDIWQEYKMEDKSRLDELIEDIIYFMKCGYFLQWEAIVRQEQGLTLTEKQQQALDELISFNDEENEGILYIDEMPRPYEPWYKTVSKVASTLVIDPFKTYEIYSEVVHEGWPSLLECLEEYGGDLSLPEGVDSPIEVIPIHIRHRLWLQKCFDELSGLGQDEELTLANEEQKSWRIEGFIDKLKENKASVQFFELNLEKLLSLVILPQKDEEILVGEMLKELGLRSTQEKLAEAL